VDPTRWSHAGSFERQKWTSTVHTVQHNNNVLEEVLHLLCGKWQTAAEPARNGTALIFFRAESSTYASAASKQEIVKIDGTKEREHACAKLHERIDTINIRGIGNGDGRRSKEEQKRIESLVNESIERGDNIANIL